MKKRTRKEKKGGVIEYLEGLKPEVDKVIEEYFPKKTTDKWLNFTFGRPRYRFNLKTAEESLSRPIWDFLSRGGKRWRPALFLLIAEAVGGDIKKVRDFAIIPELIHQGTIIIDDIEDRAELRRGKPALHKIFGTDIALNAGNFLYFFPLLVLRENREKFKPEILLRAYETYIQEMVNLGFGQGTDIYWHKGKAGKIGEKEYLQMVAFKTGCLSRLSAKLAVLLSGGSHELAEKLGRMAEAIGVAFQIQDDILDIALEGKEREKFGKSFGNDIKEGKRTLLVIHALRRAEPKAKKRLVGILNKHTDNLAEIKEAIAIIKEQGGINYAKTAARKIVSDAWQGAAKLLPESNAKKKLSDFVNYLITRKM